MAAATTNKRIYKTKADGGCEDGSRLATSSTETLQHTGVSIKENTIDPDNSRAVCPPNNAQFLQIWPGGSVDNPLFQVRTISRHDIWSPTSKEYNDLRETFRQQMKNGIQHLLETGLLVPSIHGPITISGDLTVAIPGLPDNQQWQEMDTEEKKAAGRAINPSLQHFQVPHEDIVEFLSLLEAQPFFKYLARYQRLVSEIRRLMEETEQSQRVEVASLLQHTRLLELKLDWIQIHQMSLVNDYNEAISMMAGQPAEWVNPMDRYAEVFRGLFGKEKAVEWLSPSCSWRGEIQGVCGWWAQVKFCVGQLNMHYSGECSMTPANLTKIKELLAESSELLVESISAFAMPAEAAAIVDEWEDTLGFGSEDEVEPGWADSMFSDSEDDDDDDDDDDGTES